MKIKQNLVLHIPSKPTSYRLLQCHILERSEKQLKVGPVKFLQLIYLPIYLTAYFPCILIIPQLCVLSVLCTGVLRLQLSKGPEAGGQTETYLGALQPNQR